MDANEIREALKAMYGGENKSITDGNYNKELAVRCINGTFVGRKKENIIAYRGIPYVGKQPVGNLRWKALVESFMKDVKGDYFQPDASLFSQSWFNAAILRLAEEQTKGGGRAYMYYFTPEAADPIMKCGHAIELSIVFHHLEEISDLGRAFDETFCRAMRRMWVQFAKTGNPSPDWPLYDRKDKPVMVLDEFNIHPAKESEVKIVDWDRTYFLTKYYCI